MPNRGYCFYLLQIFLHSFANWRISIGYSSHPSIILYFCLNRPIIKQNKLLYSWRFSSYSAPVHWLVHVHMTSNNETVSRQMPSGNIAKAMTSNGKQFTVTRSTVHCRLLVHVFITFARFHKFCFCFVLLYNKSLNDCSPRDQSLSV